MPQLHEFTPILGPQRSATLKTLLAAYRSCCAAYFGHDRIGERSLDVLIGMAVLIGQADGRLMTATDAAAYIGAPRATVSRRLIHLEQQGHIGRRTSGKRHVAWVLTANDADVLKHVSRMIAILKKLADELSKMSNSTVD